MTAQSLLDKMKKSGAIKATVLTKSDFFQARDTVSTSIPALNVALSGALNGGINPGLTLIAGPSRTFKSNTSMMILKAYLDKYPEAICLFYDSEFGSLPEYFRQAGIDTDRVLHIPITDLEELKFDIIKRLEDIARGDKVFIYIDSIGNLASKKEVEDALKENSAQDMTRAKVLKSLFRIITPKLTLKNIPMVAINHTYDTLEMYAKRIMSGGQGPLLSANTVLFTSRSQEKVGTELVGYNFTLTAEKSRTIREKSKFEMNATFDGGVYKYSGFLDWAMEGQFIVKPKNGWYQEVDEDGVVIETKSYREKDLDVIFAKLLNNKRFQEFVTGKYLLPSSPDSVEEVASGTSQEDLDADDE